MLKELIKIANELDVRGLTQEADLLDKIATDISKSASRIPREDQADWYGWGCNPAYRLNPLAESGWPCCWPPEDIPNENCKPWQMSEVEKKYWDSRKDLNIRRDIQTEIANSSVIDALDWGLMGAALVADMIPGPGTAVSSVLNAGSISVALAQKNILGAALGVVMIVAPGAGDALGIFAKLIKSGQSVPISALRQVQRLLLRGVDARVQKWITSNLQDLAIEGISDVGAAMSNSLNSFRESIDALIKENEAQGTRNY